LVRDWPNFDADWDEEVEGDGEGAEKDSKAAAEEDEDDGLVVVETDGDGEVETKKGSHVKSQKKEGVYRTLREEMRTYLRDVIKDRGLGDLQSTREQIARCFSTVDCFLLPHPGLAVTKKNFDGSLDAIGSSFKGLINRYSKQHAEA
jgi:hypothetical protein